MFGRLDCSDPKFQIISWLATFLGQSRNRQALAHTEGFKPLNWQVISPRSTVFRTSHPGLAPHLRSRYCLEVVVHLEVADFS